MKMARTAGYKFTIMQPNGEWHDVGPKLYKTTKGAEAAGYRYVDMCAEEGWRTEYRIETVPALNIAT